MATFVLQRAGRCASRALQRWSSAAAVPLTERPPYFDELESQGRKPSEDVKVSKLSNGITVASLENHSFSSSLSLYVMAGSRCESYTQQGLTHLLRKAAFLSAGNRSSFKMSREMDYVGGILSAKTTREAVVYGAQFLRGNLDLALDLISSAITSPNLKEWEVRDLAPLLELEVAAHESDPSSVVVEELHHAAFRNALSNSLYCPRHNIGSFTSSDLRSYREDWFVGKRMALVGLGMDHQELVSMAESSFSPIREGLTTTDEACSYYGGGEAHIATRSHLTHAAIVCKGASLTSQKDILSAGVLQHLLGIGPSVKWGNSGSSLFKCGLEAVDTPFNACSLNINYSDNGLFGFYANSEPQAMEKFMKAIMQGFNSVAKGNVSNTDISRAKNQLKASYLMSTEQSSSLSDDIASQTMLKGSYTPIAATNQQVDALTTEDVVQFAKSVFSTRPTYVTHGDLSSTPRMQQLLEGISLR